MANPVKCEACGHTVYRDRVMSQTLPFLGNPFLCPGLAFCANFPSLFNPAILPWVLGLLFSFSFAFVIKKKKDI